MSPITLKDAKKIHTDFYLFRRLLFFPPICVKLVAQVVSLYRVIGIVLKVQLPMKTILKNEYFDDFQHIIVPQNKSRYTKKI